MTLQDQSLERIAPAIQRAARFSSEAARRPQVRFAPRPADSRPVRPGRAQADVVIEAIFENLEAKRKLFADIEADR